MALEIIGREREIERLQRCMEEKEAQLVVVYGRRRIGKTYLIDTVFEKKYDFTFVGAHKLNREAQLDNFANEIQLQTGQSKPKIKNWRDAFVILRQYLSSLDYSKKRIVFFDELPWMETHKSHFLDSFEWFWNSWGSKQDNLIMIVSGSATSWMNKKISDNKGGLFNRQTCRLYLEPFTLYETEKYLNWRGIYWSRIDIAECYMITGGIPYYLRLLNPNLLFRENIDNLFFKKRGELWDEFSHLYHTIFENGDQHAKLAEVLSKKGRGLTRKELGEMTGFSSSKTLTKILNDLIVSGFVRVEPYYGHKKKDTVYQLCDYYTLFYFRFIKNRYGIDESFWSKSFDHPSRRVWCGLTFELLCKDHVKQIKQALGILGVTTETFGWYQIGKQMEDGERRGAQIDMVLDRRDMSINICEMKFSMNEFEIDKDYNMNLRNKIETFRLATNTQKTLALTMITTFGVKKNMYGGIVNSQVVLDDLFIDVK